MINEIVLENPTFWVISLSFCTHKSEHLLRFLVLFLQICQARTRTLLANVNSKNIENYHRCSKIGQNSLLLFSGIKNDNLSQSYEKASILTSIISFLFFSFPLPFVYFEDAKTTKTTKATKATIATNATAVAVVNIRVATRLQCCWYIVHST